MWGESTSYSGQRKKPKQLKGFGGRSWHLCRGNQQGLISNLWPRQPLQAGFKLCSPTPLERGKVRFACEAAYCWQPMGAGGAFMGPSFDPPYLCLTPSPLFLVLFFL